MSYQMTLRAESGSYIDDNYPMSRMAMKSDADLIDRLNGLTYQLPRESIRGNNPFSTWRSDGLPKMMCCSDPAPRTISVLWFIGDQLVKTCTFSIADDGVVYA